MPVVLYKAIYVPEEGAAAYMFQDIPARNWRTAPISELIAAGIDPFPGISGRQKGRVLRLSAPFGYHRPG